MTRQAKSDKEGEKTHNKAVYCNPLDPVVCTDWRGMDHKSNHGIMGLCLSNLEGEAYHGVDEHESRLKRSNDLNDLIVRLYSLDRYHPAVAYTHLYRKSLEDILKTSDQSRRSWLCSVDAALTGYCIRVPMNLTPVLHTICGGTPLLPLGYVVCETTMHLSNNGHHLRSAL